MVVLARIAFRMAVIGVLTSTTFGHSQVADDLRFIRSIRDCTVCESTSAPPFDFKETSEAKLLTMGAVRLYQLAVSRHDTRVCNFHPSCSRFAMQALRQYGLFHGILIASDRVQRCNGLGRAYYAIDMRTGLSIDHPVEAYFVGPSHRGLDEREACCETQPTSE